MKARSFSKNRRAQALIEFLMILFVTLMCLFFIFEYVLLVQARSAMNMAAYAAARQYAVGPTSLRAKLAVGGRAVNWVSGIFGDSLGLDFSPAGLALSQANYHLKPFVKRGILTNVSLKFDPTTEPGFGQPQMVTVQAEVSLCDLPFFKQFYAKSNGKCIMTAKCLTIME